MIINSKLRLVQKRLAVKIIVSTVLSNSCVFLDNEINRISVSSSSCVVSGNLRRQLCLGHLFLHKAPYPCNFFRSACRSFDTDLETNERRKKLLREIKARETRQLSINKLARRLSLFYSAGEKFLGRYFSRYNISETALSYL